MSMLVLVFVQFLQFINADITESWQDRYDYIIIGGGTAGCVLANRLSEDPRNSVLVLEAGSEPINPFIPVPRTWRGVTTDARINWGFVTEKQPFTGTMNGVSWLSGKVLGGSSAIIPMLVTRGSPDDYDEWYNMGNEGWSYNDLLYYFKKLENVLSPEIANSEFRGVNGDLDIQIGYKDPMVDKFLDAAKDLGFDELLDYNGPNIEGYGWGQFHISDKGQRITAYDAFLKPVLTRRNFDVVTNALVTKIRFNDDGTADDSDDDKKQKTKIRGVNFIRDEKNYKVIAKKEIIITAGCINSPKLLMLSGIGPKEHLNHMNITVIKDLPVGKNLQDHSIVFNPIRFSDSSPVPRPKMMTFEALFQYLFTGKGPWSSFASMVVSFHRSLTQDVNERFPYIEQLIFENLLSFNQDFAESIRNGSGIIPELLEELKAVDNNPRVVLAGTGHMHPRTRGTVTLKSTDPKINPIIDYPMIDNNDDIKDFIEGIRRFQRFVGTTVLQDAGVMPFTCTQSACSNETLDSDAYWECCVRYSVTTMFHYVGTCKMDNGKSGVVDDKLRVHGTKGLRVADSSIMPLIPTAHPNIPTIVIALKAADMILNTD